MTDCWLITNEMSYNNNSVIVVISGIGNRLNSLYRSIVSYDAMCISSGYVNSFINPLL